MVNMKARYTGRCPGCGTKISSGDEISVLLGRWHHTACKKAAIAARTAAAGPAVEIPRDETEENTPRITGTKRLNRRSLMHLRRTR